MTHLLRVSAITATLCVVGSCGGRGTPSAPTSPAPAATLPVVVASVSQQTLQAVRETAASTGDVVRFRITTEITLRETAGVAVRVARLALAVTDSATGYSSLENVDTDIAVAANGSVVHSLSHVIAVTADRVSHLRTARWRVSGAGADERGRSCEVGAAEATLVFPTAATTSAPVADETILAAGDIARCGSPNHELTARVLDRSPGTVLALGDLAYMSGLAEEFRDCYEPSWGRHKRRTRPAPGNHDWDVTGGGPYFAYFGANAGPAGLGYHSYTLGAWLVLSLNSNVPAQVGSVQHEFVRSTLASSRTDCVLAYWHHPLFSSGPNGNVSRMRDVWRLLSEAGADLILQGHDHIYERFSQQDADGRPDAQRGIRSFVVGTGGMDLTTPRTRQPNSELIESRTFGVLKVQLRSSSYDWEYLPVDGQSFRDFGGQACTPAR